MSETIPERLPYGQAKRIVASMAMGDGITVRPHHMVSFHNAARRLGMRLAAVSTTTKDGPMFHMVRVAEGITAHRICRLPRRDQISGRWLRRFAST